MRKLISLRLFFLSIATFLVLSACKKQDQNSNDKALMTKVNSWLDKLKSVSHPNQSANIELLKKNLDFSDVHYEQLNEGEKFLIIPILENYKTEKKVEKNINLQLALVVDRLNDITRGTILMYIPSLAKSTTIPVGTLSKLYHNEPLEVNGMIRFLTVSGSWLYEYTIKDGKIAATGFIREANNLAFKNQTTQNTNATCIDWYLVTTYYENGVVVDEEEVYLGRTCYGCDDPNLMSLCPLDYEGGGLGDQVSDCCVPDPNVQWSSQHTAEKIPTSPGPETTDPSTGAITKTWSLSWYYDFNSLLGWNWNYRSYETATLEKQQNNTWKFISLVHNSHGNMEGTIPPCVEFHHFVDNVTSTIENNGSRARVTIAMHDTFRISCIPTSSTTSDSGVASISWDAN